MIGTIISALVIGLVIGALARLFMPGKQDISLLMTAVLGAVGSVAGSAIFKAVSGRSDTKGIDWIALILGVIVAGILISIYLSITGRKNNV